MPFSRGSSLARDQTCISYVSCIGGFFTTNAIWEAQILVESELHRVRSRGGGGGGGRGARGWSGFSVSGEGRGGPGALPGSCELAPGLWGRHREGILGRGEGLSKGSKEWEAKPEEPLFSSMSPLLPEARISSQAICYAPTHSLS